MVAVQNYLPENKSPVGLAILVFFQTFSGAVFLAFAQTAFSLGLNDALAKYAPTVSPITVVTAGATKFRQVVDNGALDGVILAYNEALQHVFYIATGASVGMFIAAWGMGFTNIKKKKEEKEKAAAGGSSTPAPLDV